MTNPQPPTVPGKAAEIVPTPRTDATLKFAGGNLVTAAFARQLERELVEANQEIRDSDFDQNCAILELNGKLTAANQRAARLEEALREDLAYHIEQARLWHGVDDPENARHHELRVGVLEQAQADSADGAGGGKG